jgi:mannose-6-phosphate isomerase
MPALYPLRFQPVLKRYLWGGRKLGETLGKPIGEGNDYAESWELVDRTPEQSVVTNGELSGKTLRELLSTHGKEILGQHWPQERFPLLFKFLDCQNVLSVQVHPDDAGGAKLTPPDLGKTEAWVILDAAPGSVLYAGLKRGFDRAALEREVQRGTTELCLHKIEPRAGDCIFIPAGVVHALGSGMLVAEIQQASDTTFRLFDWNRVGPDGKPRELHIDKALDAIDYATGPVDPQLPQPTDHPAVERLVTCDKFVLNRVQLSPANPQWQTHLNHRFHLLAGVSGEAQVEADGKTETLAGGQTLLVPACLDGLTVRGTSATLLDIHLP